MLKQINTRIEELFTNNYQKYYRLAYSYVQSPEDAMDVVQESAYKALKNSKGLKNAQYAETWVYRIVINTALDSLKTRKREVPGVEDYQQEYIQEYTNFDVMDSLKKLDPNERAVIILRFFEDLKLSDIARVLEENESTVKSRLYRALKVLKVELDEFREA